MKKGVFLREKGISGFTLFEVVVALSLLLLLCALAIPTLSHLQGRLTLLNTAHQIASIIRLARIEALEKETQTKVLFDILGNSVIFQVGKNTVRYKIPRGVFLYTTNFPSHELRFLPRGTPMCGGTIALRTKRNRKYVIVVPVTGRVRLSDTPSM